MSVIVEYLQPVLKLWILYRAGKVFFVEYALQKKEFYVKTDIIKADGVSLKLVFVPI